MGKRTKLYSTGSLAVLKLPELAKAVHRSAERIAQNARAAEPEADIVVDDYTTDRVASSVTVREAQARIWQARDGHLTKAAGLAGFEVKSR